MDQKKHWDQVCSTKRTDEFGWYKPLLQTSLTWIKERNLAADAPPKCSGLPVQRYTQEQLHVTLGEELELICHGKEQYVTPGGVEQMYTYRHFCRPVNEKANCGKASRLFDLEA